MGALKGQNLRVFLGDSPIVVAQATSCTITYTGNTEDTRTKDDGNAAKNSVNSKSWQIQVESLNISDIKSILTAVKSGTAFTLTWDETSGAGNAVAQEADFARTGSAFLTDATFQFNDREWSSKSMTFTGTGGVSALSEE